MTDKLMQLFSEVLDLTLENLNEETSQKNTWAWDSLATMHLVAAIEDRFEICLTTKEIMAMSSIGLARKILKEKNIEL